MEIPFKVNSWNYPITTGSTTEPGMRIPFGDFNVKFPVIQVFEDLGSNELQLIIDPSRLAVTTVNDDIVLIASNAFNGVVVIR